MKEKNNYPKARVYKGTVDHVSVRSAYIIVKGLKQDILVPQAHLNGVMHQDEVEVVTNPKKPKEGRIRKIIKRANREVVGRIIIDHQVLFLIPDHKRLHDRIKILANRTDHELIPDDKVVLTIAHYPTEQQLGEGYVVKYLGPMGSHHAETQAIIAQFNLQEDFDLTIEEEVKRLPSELSTLEIKRRRDFRDVTTFTIDPVSAKDFDDALSIRHLPSGDIEVGVHVADVTHYVKAHTPLDQEAQRRATSVYLVDHTVPMLPERLSNDLCSLKPHVDRPAFSLIATLDEEANVKNIDITETVIHSNHRFTYDEAHQVLAQGQGPFYKELATLDRLAKKLRKLRIEKGAICFASSDIDIQLDADGNPTDIKTKKSHTTHQLIEEFMLLANRLIARTIWGKKHGQHHLPFIYRTHDKPEAQKVADFARFVSKLGYKFNTNPDHLPQSYNKLLENIRGKEHESIIQMFSIRTMSQATYSSVGKPHFGLAFPHYTHFTSPIRRYPDLIIHRLVKSYLQEDFTTTLNLQACTALAQHASARERVAVEAERASIACKQAVFVKQLEGKVLEGVIIGITEWGLYVELKAYKCEGMIRLSDIPGDFYIYDPAMFCVRGKHKKKVYNIGESIRVLIKNADIAKRQVDMLMA